jgi:predicted SAM-dependent methyltransferase
MRSLKATSDEVVKDKGLVLDIGCGENKKGHIGIDIRETKVVDIVADARFLPFRDESFDSVYSSHTIEHFSHREVKNVLAEWVRVLKKGGVMEVRCPDPHGKIFVIFMVHKIMMVIIISVVSLMVC